MFLENLFRRGGNRHSEHEMELVTLPQDDTEDVEDDIDLAELVNRVATPADDLGLAEEDLEDGLEETDRPNPEDDKLDIMAAAMKAIATDFVVDEGRQAMVERTREVGIDDLLAISREVSLMLGAGDRATDDGDTSP